jgi:hypothetical protein
MELWPAAGIASKEISKRWLILTLLEALVFVCCNVDLRKSAYGGAVGIYIYGQGVLVKSELLGTLSIGEVDIVLESDAEG